MTIWKVKFIIDSTVLRRWTVKFSRYLPTEIAPLRPVTPQIKVNLGDEVGVPKPDNTVFSPPSQISATKGFTIVYCRL